MFYLLCKSYFIFSKPIWCAFVCGDHCIILILEN